MIKEDHIQTLMDFGLSLLQAKVYLNLVRLETAEVKTIAKASNVPRQDIYRIMPLLLEMGLGEKVISQPTMYKATPLRKGLSILLQRKKEKYTELQEKKKLLLEEFSPNNHITAPPESTPQFKITSEITLLLKMHKRLIQNAHETIDVILPVVVKPSKLVEEWLYLDKSNKKRRRVEIRLITIGSAKLTRKHQEIAENAFLKLKFLASPVPFGMHIFDRKEVTLSISREGGLPCLWSNNPNVVILSSTLL